jgi:hypothetical protein
MVRRGAQSHNVHARALARRRGGHSLAGLALVALLALAGCAAQGHAQPTATLASTATVSAATATPTMATTPTPQPVQITDLNAFRQQLANAVTSGQLSKVQPLLSPTFSFQAQTSGSHLLMPDAATHLGTSLQQGNPWSVGDSYYLSIHSCYAGDTPLQQVIGFIGNNNHYILLGIAQPDGQAYWQVAWGFEDPQGPYDGCITGE